jgi:hypothetical protein
MISNFLSIRIFVQRQCYDHKLRVLRLSAVKQTCRVSIFLWEYRALFG